MRVRLPWRRRIEICSRSLPERGKRGVRAHAAAALIGCGSERGAAGHARRPQPGAEQVMMAGDRTGRSRAPGHEGCLMRHKVNILRNWSPQNRVVVGGAGHIV